MKKIGIAILCRYSSSRLPGKILMEIENLPILHHIHNRLRKIFSNEQLVITTSQEATDDKITDYCEKHNFNFFRGSLNNVADRVNSVAQKSDWEYIIRINGDNLFIDLATLSTMIDICNNGDYDFISNVQGRTFPYGMSIEIIKCCFYNDILPLLATPRYQEHVTLYLYEHPELGNQYHHKNTQVTEMQGAKMAIDELKDFEFASILMKKLKQQNFDYTLEDLNSIIKNLDIEKLAR